jgi:DNA-binding CsgD family transcriptional regulator
VKEGPALENLTGAIIDTCRSGLSPDVLRERVLSRLRRAVPFDAAFWSIVDPATLLFTQAHQEEIPPDTIPYFIENEYLANDVNKWTALAGDRVGVRTLVEATGGEIEASSRYRDIFRPLGLGDELRAVLRSGDVCWGYLCLHREVGTPFSTAEVRYVNHIAPHIAEGIRATLLAGGVEDAELADAPGLLLLSPGGSVISATAAGEMWMAELGHPDPARRGVPSELLVLATRFSQDDAETPTRLRMRTRAGRWALLHASRLPGAGSDAVAVIIEEPAPAELAPVLMMTYGLTKQERSLTGLVCRGLSTKEIAARLHITPNTIQDHLKSIFEKTGVSSRRELVATILQEQYLPRMMAGRQPGPSGFFDPSDAPR